MSACLAKLIFLLCDIYVDPFLTHSFALSFSQDSNRMFESEGRPTNKTRSQCQVLSLFVMSPSVAILYLVT